MKKTLYDRALNTAYHSRFVAIADDLNRPLTDKEVKEEAAYLLECLPYSCTYDELDSRGRATLKRQLKALAS